MRPFFSFFGGKWASAGRYPAPTNEVIVEPFAGSAGYSVRHFDHQIILIEKDPVIAAVWRLLISATPAQILALPDLPNGCSVDDLPVSQAEKYLIGFWLNKGHPTPCKTASAWMRNPKYSAQFWGPRIRERIADQVDMISHWEIIEGGYECAPDVHATWFVDPPYQDQGRRYRCSLKTEEFPSVADFCRSRRGQVIACEQDGAGWLPFTSIGKVKATSSKRGKVSPECVWLSAPAQSQEQGEGPNEPGDPGIVIPPPELTVAERENWTLEHQIRGILRLCPETLRPESHSAGDLIEAANYLRDLIEAQTVQVCRERDGFAARVLELEVSDCEISALEERAERAETKLQRNGARLVEFMEAIRLPEDERQAAILAMGHGPAAEGSRETQEDPA